MVIRSAARVLTVGLLMTALAGCASQGSSAGGASLPPGSLPVSLPTPATITRHGITYHVAAVAPAAATRDAADPNAVEIFVFQSEDRSYPRCSSLAPLARVAGENRRTVFVAAFAYQKPSTGDVRCVSSQPEGDESAYARLTLHLHAALGSRTLIDVKTGRTIGISERQQPPTPSWLPVGYRQSLVEPFDAEADFLAIRQYQRKAQTIEIRVRSASAWVPDGTVVDRVDVAGQRATLTDQSYERCLTWTGDDGLISEVCSLNAVANYLSPNQLVRIARSLHP